MPHELTAKEKEQILAEIDEQRKCMKTVTVTYHVQITVGDVPKKDFSVWDLTATSESINADGSINHEEILRQVQRQLPPN